MREESLKYSRPVHSMNDDDTKNTNVSSPTVFRIKRGASTAHLYNTRERVCKSLNRSQHRKPF